MFKDEYSQACMDVYERLHFLFSPERAVELSDT